MEPSQIITMILTSGVAGIIITKLLDWAKESRAGRMQSRRAEVDRAITERDKAITQRDAAEAAEEAQARRVRIVEESLAIHRRTIVDAPCLGPTQLPPYPRMETQ